MRRKTCANTACGSPSTIKRIRLLCEVTVPSARHMVTFPSNLAKLRASWADQARLSAGESSLELPPKGKRPEISQAKEP